MAAETNVIAGEDLGAGRGRPLGVRRKGRQPRDTTEIVAAVRRMLRALGIRAATEDPETLLELIELHSDLETAILRGVAGQRAAGITWEYIGSATGTTRQAAIQKWGPKLGKGVSNGTLDGPRYHPPGPGADRVPDLAELAPAEALKPSQSPG